MLLVASVDADAHRRVSAWTFLARLPRLRVETGPAGDINRLHHDRWDAERHGLQHIPGNATRRRPGHGHQDIGAREDLVLSGHQDVEAQAGVPHARRCVLDQVTAPLIGGDQSDAHRTCVAAPGDCGPWHRRREPHQVRRRVVGHAAARQSDHAGAVQGNRERAPGVTPGEPVLGITVIAQALADQGGGMPRVVLAAEHQRNAGVTHHVGPHERAAVRAIQFVDGKVDEAPMPAPDGVVGSGGTDIGDLVPAGHLGDECIHRVRRAGGGGSV